VNIDHDDVKFKIYINPLNGTLDKEIFLNGVYEPYFLSRIKQELRMGDTFVDIGSNICQHGLFASYVVGDTGKVIAFEPIKRLFGQINRNIEVNNIKNIIAHNLACGEKTETSLIHKRDANIGGSSIVTSVDRKDSEEIQIVAADSILEKESQVNFIKIDVEGYEYFALLGLAKTIEKFKPKILIEFTPYLYNLSHPEHSIQILNLLLQAGYNIYDLEHKDMKLFSAEDFMVFINKENILQTNLLCIYK
jgi:FkbM family methyltransferase